jgi:hypothetical protein
LLALLRSDEPDRYRAAVVRLQRAEDPALQDNAFVQMRAILSLSL